MARKYQFLTIANTKKLLLVAVIAGFISLGLFGYNQVQKIQESRKAYNAQTDERSFVSEFDATDTLEEQVAKLSDGLGRVTEQVKQLTNNQVPQQVLETKEQLSRIEQQLSAISGGLSQQAERQGVNETRIERLEKLVKTIVTNGAGVGGGTPTGAMGNDGARLTSTGAAVYGEEVADDVANPPPPAPEQTQGETYDYFIPSGTRVRFRMIDYALAPAGGLSQLNSPAAPAFPAFVQILDDVELADGSIVPLSNEGVAQFMITGDASNERGMPTLQTLRFYNGENYYELGKVSAAVMDTIDRAPGLMGRLDKSKRGAEIAKAAALTATKMFTTGLSAAQGGIATGIPTVNPTTGAINQPQVNLAAIGWAAAGSSIDQFIQLFLNNAAQYFDVIHISDKIAVKRKDGKIVTKPHEGWLVFKQAVFVKKQGS